MIRYLLGMIIGGLTATIFFSMELVNTHEYYENKLPGVAKIFHQIGCRSALNGGKPLLAEDKELCDKLTIENVEMYERIWKYDLPEDF